MYSIPRLIIALAVWVSRKRPFLLFMHKRSTNRCCSVKTISDANVNHRQTSSAHSFTIATAAANSDGSDEFSCVPCACAERKEENKSPVLLLCDLFPISELAQRNTDSHALMSNSAIEVCEPLNEPPVDVEQPATSTSSGDKIVKIFFYLFSDCLLARVLACTFICQAAIMWLGTALNFILQLLFIPFSFAASSKPDALPSSNILSFLGSYSMIPGIVAFSAHYFWFVLQIGCHCFTTTLRKFAPPTSPF